MGEKIMENLRKVSFMSAIAIVAIALLIPSSSFGKEKKVYKVGDEFLKKNTTLEKSEAIYFVEHIKKLSLP